MNINFSFDSSVPTAPAGFVAALNYVAAVFDKLFTTNVTVTIGVGYGEVNGQSLPAGAIGSSLDSYTIVSYSTVLSALSGLATTNAAKQAVNALSNESDPGAGAAIYWMSTALAKAANIAVNAPVDGYIGFANSSNVAFDYNVNNRAVAGQYDFIGVAEHEISEVLGRYSGLSFNGSLSVLDLFRYSNAARALSASSPSPYFSIDGGASRTNSFNSDPSGDYGDWASSAGNDAFAAFASPGVEEGLSASDFAVMSALGFNAAYPSGQTADPNLAQSHANDLSYSPLVTAPDNYIDGLDYIASYNDLIAAYGANAAAGQQHYNQFHRATTFDGLDYIASYGDLISAFGANIDAGATHYIDAGAREGRHITFNALDYIASYGDLLYSFGANPLLGVEHFISNGYSEGRRVTFDGLDYIASYSDLTQAFGANEQLGASHFINSGFYEGRSIKFNGLDYIASYTDLIAAFGANGDSGATHFIQNGHNEGRHVIFDGLSYIANYTDLMKAFGANEQSGAIHYIDHGHLEGRSTSFNVAAYYNAHPDLVGKYATNDAFLAAYIATYQATGSYLT
jgi:hypothetical protein